MVRATANLTKTAKRTTTSASQKKSQQALEDENAQLRKQIRMSFLFFLVIFMLSLSRTVPTDIEKIRTGLCCS